MSIFSPGCSGSDSSTTPVEEPADSAPPTLTWEVTFVDEDTLFVPGDTLRLALGASDDFRIDWVGYQIGLPVGIRDSFPGSGRTASAHIALPVSGQWLGDPALIVFAHDSAGHTTAEVVATIPVRDYARRPTRLIPLASATVAGDAAYDVKRDLLYISQSDSQRIAVVDVAAATHRTPIAVPMRPVGFDLSVSGDSLVVALRGGVHLAVIDLLTTPPTSELIELVFDTLNIAGRPDRVRVAANGLAIVALGFDGSGFGGLLMSVDLATGAQRVRTEVGIAGRISELTPLVRPLDQSAVLLYLNPFSTGSALQLYSAAMDTFGPPRPIAAPFAEAAVSADATGSRYLLGHLLFDASLTQIVTLTHDDYGDGQFGFRPSVIAPDGMTVYFGTAYGYVTVRIDDGTTIERVRLAIEPRQLMLLPDGETLIARTDRRGEANNDNQIAIVDVR